jgi:molecular chaperone GrpE
MNNDGQKHKNDDIADDVAKETTDDVVLEESEGEEVIQELEVLKQQVGDFENKYKRAIADYQNLQKRVQDEKSEWIRSANKDLLLRILTVLDTLILAYQHTQDTNIKVSIQQFYDILKTEGVTKIETLGKKFDPAIMEAIATEDGEEGKILEELRVGFMIHDKLLRAAQVKVGKDEK